MGPEEGRLGRAGDMGCEEGRGRRWGRSVGSEGRRDGAGDAWGGRVGKVTGSLDLQMGKAKCTGESAQGQRDGKNALFFE